MNKKLNIFISIFTTIALCLAPTLKHAEAHTDYQPSYDFTNGNGNLSITLEPENLIYPNPFPASPSATDWSDNRVKVFIDTNNFSGNLVGFTVHFEGDDASRITNITPGSAISTWGTKTISSFDGGMQIFLDDADKFLGSGTHHIATLTTQGESNGIYIYPSVFFDAGAQNHKKSYFASDVVNFEKYWVSPNSAPTISNIKINGSTPPESDTSPLADQNVNSTFTFDVADNTDTKANIKVQVYNGGTTKTYDGSHEKIAGNSVTTVGAKSFAINGLQYANYYKAVITATDDQGANDVKTVYFYTSADDNAPVQVRYAYMYEMKGDTDVEAAKIAFTNTSDNGGVDKYYIMSTDYLQSKGILDGSLQKTAEYNTNLQTLISDSAKVLGSASSNTITLSNTDLAKQDNSDYLMGDKAKLAENKYVLIASDTAKDINDVSKPNFSDPTMVAKPGDVIGLTDNGHEIADGIVNAFDAIHIYRNSSIDPTAYPIYTENFIDIILP